MFNLLGRIIWWTLKTSARCAWWGTRNAVTHPRSSLGVSLLGGAVYLVGWEIVAGLIGVVILGSATWRQADRDRFDQYLGDWLAAWWRHWFMYRRTWERVMAKCGLTIDHDDERHFPRLVKVNNSKYWDRLIVEMTQGQEVRDYRDSGERVRHAFRAERVTVREIEPCGVELSLMREDPFRNEYVPAALMPALTADIDFERLPIGMTEYCEDWEVSIVGAHLAVCGTSGAGKASVPWNILRTVAPAIADGTVRLHFIDPKRAELRQGRALVSRHVPISEEMIGRSYEPRILDERDSYVCGEHETLDMLRGLVADMEAAAELAGERGERNHVPTQSTPLNLIVIDELAPLLDLWSRRVVDLILKALGLLLTQGRSLGYIVIGSIQEPTKDVFKIRDLFGRRIGLRLATEAHTDAALTEKASERGALCHEIPEDLPGTAFQLLQGAKHATRSRAGHVTDADIAALVEYVSQLRLAAEVAESDAAVVTLPAGMDQDAGEVAA